MKDTYNYVTVQTDIRMPRRHFRVLADTARQAPWQAAIQAAVLRIEGEDKDCRVLNLGAGAGVLVTLNPDSATVFNDAAVMHDDEVHTMHTAVDFSGTVQRPIKNTLFGHIRMRQ